MCEMPRAHALSSARASVCRSVSAGTCGGSLLAPGTCPGRRREGLHLNDRSAANEHMCERVYI